MTYICADRGTVRCPCRLMEAGQCYTCTMIREGRCTCEDAAGWQGVCPYNEYIQQGRRILDDAAHRMTAFPFLSKTAWSEDLFTVKLAASRGFAEECRRPGAYVMAEALGYRTPVSVLRVNLSDQYSVEFLVKAVGPKSRALTEDSVMEWRVAGPYFNGLLNRRDSYPEAAAQGEDVLVIARGTAAAPLVSMLGHIKCKLYLDDENLPASFVEEYLQGQVYQRIRLNDETGLAEMRVQLEEKLKERDGSGKRIILLVSPYFAEKLKAGLSEEEQNRITVPNHGNLCCAMGICGACSFTDADGITVRLCKCSEKVIK